MPPSWEHGFSITSLVYFSAESKVLLRRLRLSTDLQMKPVHTGMHTHTDIPLFKDLFLKIPFSSAAFNQVHDESVLHTNMQYPLFVISLFCNLDGSQ